MAARPPNAIAEIQIETFVGLRIPISLRPAGVNITQTPES